MKDGVTDLDWLENDENKLKSRKWQQKDDYSRVNTIHYPEKMGIRMLSE